MKIGRLHITLARPADKRSVHPDLEDLKHRLYRDCATAMQDGFEIAQDFRHLFFNPNDNGLGRRVLYRLLLWCGEYDAPDPDDPSAPFPPTDPAELQRWAARIGVAAMIKSALYADLVPEPDQEHIDDYRLQDDGK